MWLDSGSRSTARFGVQSLASKPESSVIQTVPKLKGGEESILKETKLT